MRGAPALPQSMGFSKIPRFKGLVQTRAYHPSHVAGLLSYVTFDSRIQVFCIEVIKTCKTEPVGREFIVKTVHLVAHLLESLEQWFNQDV